MRDMLTNAASIAIGILAAMAVYHGAIYVASPAQSVTVDMTAYNCSVNKASKAIECQRK